MHQRRQANRALNLGTFTQQSYPICLDPCMSALTICLVRATPVPGHQHLRQCLECVTNSYDKSVCNAPQVVSRWLNVMQTGRCSPSQRHYWSQCLAVALADWLMSPLLRADDVQAADDALTAEAVQSNAGDDVGDPNAALEAEQEAGPELPRIPGTVPEEVFFSMQGDRPIIPAPSDAIGKQAPMGIPREPTACHGTTTDAGKTEPSQALKHTGRLRAASQPSL